MFALWQVPEVFSLSRDRCQGHVTQLDEEADFVNDALLVKSELAVVIRILTTDIYGVIEL